VVPPEKVAVNPSGKTNNKQVKGRNFIGNLAIFLN
jgi:hypothetical protein